jgi:hypothetical protein
MNALPRVHEGLLDEIAVAIPVRVGATNEQICDLVPSLPMVRNSRHQASGQSTRDGDLDLLSALDSPNKVGGILTQFS